MDATVSDKPMSKVTQVLSGMLRKRVFFVSVKSL